VVELEVHAPSASVSAATTVTMADRLDGMTGIASLVRGIPAA